MSTVQDLSRPKIVRRFTSELKPDSDLATQTKSYQEDLDMEIEVQERLRMQQAYHQRPIESSFSGVEIARQALQAKCDEFFRSTEEKEEAGKKKPGVLRIFHRSGTEQRLVQEIRNGEEMTVSEVSSITNNLGEKWKASNSKAAMNFNKICQKLDSHKKIFECFPNQSVYTSVLCGAVKMVVEASVNYSTIAEQLSTYVADLSERISICTNWLDLYTNTAMKERLAAIYEEYFNFFIKVASWYLKSKGSKILDSFNSNFLSTYQGTVDKIERSIQLLDGQALIENAREIKSLLPAVLPAVTESTELIMAQVLQSRKENNEVGRRMYRFLMEMDDRLERIERAQLQRPSWTTGIVSTEVLMIEETEFTETTTVPAGITRAEAQQLCQHLQTLIDQVGGSDGIRPAIQAGRLVAEPLIIRTLGKWTTATSGDDLILWIISPYELGPQTSAELAAYGIIWSAIQAEAQFISYICQRSRPGRVPGFQGVEDKAAVLAMVYSLILQLLQFQPPDDDLILQQEMLDRLTQPGERWSSALALLAYLLGHTPSLRYCIISGINLLEGGAREMCREFVDLIFSHVRNSEWPLRVLFSTSGQSRALSETVSKDSKVLSNNTFRQAKGRKLYRDLQMPE